MWERSEKFVEVCSYALLPLLLRCITFCMLRVVRTRVVLVMQTATDVRNGVGLVRTYREREGIEAGICLDVDKHTGGP